MCQCTSCTTTDAYSGLPDLFGQVLEHVSGFANWPRGEPCGPKASAAAYRAHVAQASFDARKTEPQGFRLPGLVYPITPNRIAIEWNLRQISKGPVIPAPARPAEPCKAPRHFPAQDRPRETATIYAMPKGQPKKPVGRPAIQGRRVVIKLEEEQIKRAAKLGGGNVAEGIRKALAAQSG